MSYKESVVRPYYTLNTKNKEDVLKWLNDIYLWSRSDREELRRIEKQTTYLALYLNFSPANHRVFTASASGALQVFDKREYFHLIDALVSSIINSWVSRITQRKPIFSVFPKKISDPALKGQSEIVKALLNSYFQSQHAQELDELNVRNSFIQGESYLEVLWDKRIGPLDADIQEDIKLRGDEALEEYGEDVKQERIGDVRSILHDSRNVVVQRARSYDDTEWVMILDTVPTEKLKHLYPRLADRINSSANPRVYSYDMLSTSYGLGHTVVFKFYHRSCPEVPNGKCIIATPDLILEQYDLPSDKWINNRRLPVLQLPDSRVLGSSRGFSSTVMDTTAYGQIGLNNLWLQALTNFATFSPKLLVQKGSIDLANLRTGDRNILQYGKSQAPPSMMAQEVVSQSHMLMIDKLRQSLLKVANVMPVTQGDSMPNVESRKMLDFVKDQQDLQSVPKDVQHNRFLTDWATLVFELMADMYDDDDRRVVQYFGSLKRYETLEICGEDLNIDVEISVETLNSQATTLQGRMQEIQTILSVVPGYYTPSEVVEQLQIGSPEKVYDEITAATEAARYEISQLLSGKSVKSPSRQLNLLAYYDAYVQEMQKKEIRALLPDVYDPNGTDIGNKYLTQLCTLEDIIWQVLNDPGQQSPQGNISKGDMPVLMPQLNLPAGTTYRQYLYGRYPNYPMVFKPDAVQIPNPILAQQQAMMQQFSPQSPQNIMSPNINQAPVMPNQVPRRPQQASPAASPQMGRTQ